MKWLFALVTVMSLLTPTVFAQSQGDEGVKIEDKWLLGRVEWLWLPVLGDSVKARIDSGAKTSSMSATDIEEFRKDGQRWIRFSFNHKDHLERLEAPLSRYVRIRQANSKQLDRRPVILLPVQLGGMAKEVEFTLKDRTRMIYPVLLGREFMGKEVLIDPSRLYIQPVREK
ncbi:ATP-dependent zinc protease family protein [Zobellella endophytica]|uniref:ATP-dependent zinc protease family protein n=1 Tax=Zobellella endophytica TaxID=2116700 RepID=UPI001FE37AA0|nr:ATP-dependent zinc protease [Zobellella endophytica]